MDINNYIFFTSFKALKHLGPDPREESGPTDTIMLLSASFIFLQSLSSQRDLFFSSSFKCFEGRGGLADVEAILSSLDFCSSRSSHARKGTLRGPLEQLWHPQLIHKRKGFLSEKVPFQKISFILLEQTLKGTNLDFLAFLDGFK